MYTAKFMVLILFLLFFLLLLFLLLLSTYYCLCSQIIVIIITFFILFVIIIITFINFFSCCYRHCSDQYCLMVPISIFLRIINSSDHRLIWILDCWHATQFSNLQCHTGETIVSYVHDRVQTNMWYVARFGTICTI